MEINFNLNNTQNVKFTGATRTFRRNYFETNKEILDVFEKYPKTNGIIGSLPHSWLQNIIHLPKEERGEKIKILYKLFSESFGLVDKEVMELSEHFTKVLRTLNVIPEKNQIVIKKRNLTGGMLRGAMVIQERGENKTLEPLFVKQFINRSNKHLANNNGILAELTLGLHLDRLFHSEHIIKPYFGDIKSKYMVSKYEVTPQNIKIPSKLKSEEAFDLSSRTKYFKTLQKIAGDKTDIQSLLIKKGFFHCDLHDENVLITKDKNGKLILKLIDLGNIIKYH
ncbi:hypothetical protein J6E39_08795 [bacterium]|nr:hypothetical protein [bacterium]